MISPYLLRTWTNPPPFELTIRPCSLPESTMTNIQSCLLSTADPVTAPIRKRRRAYDLGVAELLPPRKRPPPGALQESELSIRDIPLPDEHGDTYTHDLRDPNKHKFFVAKSLVPDAGYGLFAKRLLKGDSILCQYYGTTAPTNPSTTYTIHPPRVAPEDHSKDIDTYDPATWRVLCLAGFVNNTLDESKEDARWEYIDRKLYLHATRDFRPNEQIFAHYSYEYWAWLSNKWPLPLLLQIIDHYFHAVNLTDPV